VQIKRRNSNDWPVLFVHLLDFVDVLSTKPIVIICFVPAENQLSLSFCVDLKKPLQACERCHPRPRKVSYRAQVQSPNGTINRVGYDARQTSPHVIHTGVRIGSQMLEDLVMEIGIKRVYNFKKIEPRFLQQSKVH